MPPASAQEAKKPGPGKPMSPDAEAIKAFVRFAPLAVAMTDRKLRFLAVSATWFSDMALVEDQLIGRSSYEIAPETRKYEPLHRRALEGETVSGDPERIVLPNGEERWMSWQASPWRDASGEIGGMLIISHNITAQIEAEKEARRNRAFAMTVLEHSPLPLVVKDTAGRMLMMNRAMQDLLGLSDSYVGQAMTAFMPEEIARQVAEEDQAVLQSDQPLVMEEVVKFPGRSDPRMMRKTKVVIRDGLGAAYLLTIYDDITETRRTQEELERTRTFLENVIANIPAGLTVKSVDGKLLISNREASRLFGLPQKGGGTRVGLRHEDVFPAHLAARFSAQDAEVISTGEARLFEEQPVPGPDGMRYLNQRKVLISNADGADYLLSISEDVTERRKAAEDLQRTRAFLETVLNAMPAGITVKDAGTGKVLMMNPAVEDIYGVGHGQSIGKTGCEVFGKEQAQRFAEQDRQVVRSGVTTTFEDEPVQTASGRRYLRRKKVLIRNDDGPDYLLSISEDVTERKLAQDALKDAVARAEAANVAKSEFLANMSHEIRTPLNGVLGLADALSRMELSSKQAEIVHMIVGSGKALTAILSDVLDLAKAEAGQLSLGEEPISLKETIGGAAFLFETVAGDKGLDFKVGFDGDGPDRLIGDPLRIKQIVSNLISNAVKFTSRGEVAIHARSVTAGDGVAAIEVSVADTGPGFTEEARAKLFSRFEQGDGSITRQFGGTGLGLSIARTLAQMMDGDIDCTARPGEGATFVFQARLKIDEAAAGAPEEIAPQEPARPQARRLRVLLAEDHVVNQQVVQLMLDGTAELVIVGNGQEAIDVLADGDGFDVVLMDTQMPMMDGLTAIRAIREDERREGRRRMPIISLTANAMSHQVQAALQAGADLHLAKPITSEGLYAAIGQALEGTAHAAPEPRRITR